MHLNLLKIICVNITTKFKMLKQAKITTAINYRTLFNNYCSTFYDIHDQLA
jgi:hypothetical protein